MPTTTKGIVCLGIDPGIGRLGWGVVSQTGGTYILNGEYKSAQEFFSEVTAASGAEKVKEMPKWAQSKSMDKFVSTFCRITKKENPKEVYALFINNPDTNYESTIDGLLPDSEVRKVHDSLVDVLTRPGNAVLPDRLDLEKSAEAAKNAKPIEPQKEEVSQVSEAVMKRAEESAAKAALSNEDAEKRAAAAAAARERVQAKIEAARLKAEQQAEIARAEAKTAALADESKSLVKEDKAAEKKDEVPEKAEEPKEEEQKPQNESLMTKFSISDLMAEAEAKKASAPAVGEKVEEPVIEQPAVEDTAKDAIDDFAEFVDNKVLEAAPEAAEPEAAPVEEAAEPEAAPVEESAEEKPADNANKPLWDRISADDISEEEIFGNDEF